MEMSIERKTGRFTEGLRYLGYALEVFGVIGFELLLAYLIEPKLYQRDIKDFDTIQTIIHWIVTCSVWGLGA